MEGAAAAEELGVAVEQHLVHMGGGGGDDDDERDDDDDDGMDDEDDAETCSSLPRVVRDAASWLSRCPLVSAGAAVGVVLVAVGLELPGGSSRTTSLALLLVGWWLVAGLVSEGVVDVGTCLLGSLLKLTSWRHLREWCSAAVVVVGETRAWLVRLVWATLALVGTVVVVPQDESLTWTRARFHVTRLLAIALMVCFARVATVLARMRLLAGFNSRTLQGRVLKRMQHEFVLGALAGSTWNPLFLDMFASVTATSGAGGLAGGRLRAKQRQDLFLYVGSHGGDGSVLSAKSLRRRRPGKRRALATATGPEAVAKRLWRRTLPACEALCLLRDGSRAPPVSDSDKAQEQQEEQQGQQEQQEQQGDGEAELVVEHGNGKDKDKDKDKGNGNDGSGINAPVSRTPSPLWHSLRARAKNGAKAQSQSQSQSQKKWGSAVFRPKIYMQDMAALIENLDLSDESVDMQELELAGVLGELFDAGGAEYVTQQRFSQAVVGVFKDSVNLSVTLLDSRRVLASIDAFSFAFALVLILFVSLTLYDIDFLAVWISLSTVAISFAFIFGKTLQVSFENAIFIFANRPFDVGDHISFPPAYQRYVVSRINLFTTEMIRWDGHSTRFDNHRLAGMQPLLNLSTSTGRSLNPTFLVDLECCTAAFVRAVDAELHDYVNAHEQTFSDQGCYFAASEIIDPFKMRCVFYAHLADNIAVDVFKSRRDESDFCVACAEMLQRNGARFSRAYDRPYFAPYDPPRVAHPPPKGLGVEVARPSPAGLQAYPPHHDGLPHADAGADIA